MTVPSLATAVPLYLFESVASAPSTAPGGNMPLNRRPSIADTGEVVLSERYLDGGIVRERIRVVAADGTDRIAADEASVNLDIDFETNPVISDDGEYISFTATDSDGLYGVYRVDSAGLITRIVREGDKDTEFVSVENITCRTGCPVSNYQTTNQGEPKLDGRVAFYKLQGPPGTLESGSIAAGRGGDVYPLKSGPKATPNMHQANTGQVYFIVENADGVISTIDGTSFNQILYSGSGYYDFSDVALETLATNGPMTAAVVTGRRSSTGEAVVLQRISPTEFDEVATEIGPFDAFREVSVNKYQEIVFGADLDIQGSGIFTGDDAANNRVIGPGDVLFGQTVVSVGLQKAEALNDDGIITLWAELADGTQHILRAQSFADYLSDLDIQMSLPKGGSLSVASALQGAFPTSAFDLEFDVDFLTGMGMLEVLIGDMSLGTLRSESVPSDGIYRFAGISPQPFFGDLQRGETVDLRFLLTGQDGATIRLDNVAFLQDGRRLDLLSNGDFEEGYLSGWRVEGSEGATAFAKSVPNALAPVPLPASAFLLIGALGLCATATRLRRRRIQT
ncbi:hypothetical protein [Pseudoruegeria sp. HB172150]|uniref:hypothetical protein n=1 Tax=Pseudoruegeria sp. HB172150 TaxID=2721164 RepID=UPI001C12FBC8|nr:hypothetical protein [Pseudoruegeria sp. HB172150]